MEGRLELALVFDAGEQDGDGFSCVVLELDNRSGVSSSLTRIQDTRTHHFQRGQLDARSEVDRSSRVDKERFAGESTLELFLRELQVAFEDIVERMC